MEISLQKMNDAMALLMDKQKGEALIQKTRQLIETDYDQKLKKVCYDLEKKIREVSDDLVIEGLVGPDSENFLHDSFPKFLKNFYNQVSDDLVQNTDSIRYATNKVKNEAIEGIEALDKKISTLIIESNKEIDGRIVG